MCVFQCGDYDRWINGHWICRRSHTNIHTCCIYIQIENIFRFQFCLHTKWFKWIKFELKWTRLSNSMWTRTTTEKKRRISTMFMETINMEDRMYITCPNIGMSWGSLSLYFNFFFLYQKNRNQFYINISKESMTSKFLSFHNIPEINLVLFFSSFLYSFCSLFCFYLFREATRAFLYNTRIENCSHILYYMYV